MAQFDPTQRRETWLFQELGRDPNNKKLPVYRALKYVLVQYDGDPQMYLEPVPPDEVMRSNDPNLLAPGTGYNIVNPRTDGLGRMVGAQYFGARPFEAFSYDDFDASTVGQL